ncbi:hypothetical protein SAMN06265379_104287 [Saccharicrinis carchari]|uniref:Uncharacterized protein n=1 Tax=Saccharicrinis carchari TaxID=1168039 RepID=A0A521D660_SACCC|nr:hypothetical protein SAMN06265379_104287 [Saccharicrinis carchari]
MFTNIIFKEVLNSTSFFLVVTGKMDCLYGHFLHSLQ